MFLAQGHYGPGQDGFSGHPKPSGISGGGKGVSPRQKAEALYEAGPACPGGSRNRQVI